MTREWSVIDSETDPFKAGRVPRPFAWGWFDGAAYRSWWGPEGRESLIDHLIGLGRDHVVYAHNGGKFDFHFLLPFLDPDAELLLIDGRIAKARIRHGPELRDSFLLVPEPLAAYAKQEISYAKMEASQREKHRAEILEYLHLDCVYLWELVDAMIEELGPVLTISQGALRKACKMLERERPRQRESVDSMLRPWYFGGRVSCFKLGHVQGPLVLLDVNSAYAWAMSTRAHPIGAPTVEWENALPKDGFYFAEALTDSGGALPLREDGFLTFPSDRPRWYHTNRWELEAAIGCGLANIENVGNVVTFPEEIHFGKFIDHYWRERKRAKREGDRLRDLICKRTMNATYGKMAMDPRRFRRHRIADHQGVGRLLDDGMQLVGQLGPWWLCQRPAPNPYGFLAIETAASITASVRARLLEALTTVEEPIYCDTDSILCRDPRSLPIGGELGEWEIEAEVSEAWIAGKKLYAMRLRDGSWKTASKGCRLTPRQLIDVAEGRPVESEAETPTFRTAGPPIFIDRTVRRTGQQQCLAGRATSKG